MLKPGLYDYLDPIGAPAQRIEVREVGGELVAVFPPTDEDEGAEILVKDMAGDFRPGA